MRLPQKAVFQHAFGGAPWRIDKSGEAAINQENAEMCCDFLRELNSKHAFQLISKI